MELTYLRYFKTIAEQGSMTAAAKALGVSQPTVTVAVKSLETELGTKLLLRNRDGVTLTETGHELVRHANEVFEVLARAERKSLAHRERGGRPLRDRMPRVAGGLFLASHDGALLGRGPVDRGHAVERHVGGGARRGDREER